jgi:hypothetical protein
MYPSMIPRLFKGFPSQFLLIWLIRLYPSFPLIKPLGR